MIASNTKALTTLLLARLVDDGKLGWDTRVTSLLPSFKLGDAATTQQVLVRHLICACTGLPRQDFEWLMEFKTATPESALAVLGTIQPTSKFGEMFQYSNGLAAAGGYVAGHVAFPDLELGAAYDQAMSRRVFGPLGMTSTTFDFKAALAANHAAPHALSVDDKPAAANMDVNSAIVPMRPAGGAWSNVRDVLRYVAMELGKGVLPDGTRYIDEAPLLMRRAAQVPIGKDEIYGMGLEVDSTWGIPVVHHGGSLIGYKTDMMFLPDQNVGAVVLTNSDAGQLMLGPFQRKLLEILFDGQAQADARLEAGAKSLHTQIAAERAKLTIPPENDGVRGLASHYMNASLGDIDVRSEAATGVDTGSSTLVRLRRVEEQGGVEKKSRRNAVVRDDYSRHGRSRVRRRERIGADAHVPGRSARVCVHREVTAAFVDIHISAIEYALPDRSVALETLAAEGRLASPPEVLRAFGFDRAWIGDGRGDGLAGRAARSLIERTGCDPASIGLLLYAGAAPGSHAVGEGLLGGFSYPAAGLQYELGLGGARVIGISQVGCLGLMTAVSVARRFLVSDPSLQRVLCVSADALPAGSGREVLFNLISDGACAVFVDRGRGPNRIVTERYITKGYYSDCEARANEIVASYFPTSRAIILETLAELGGVAEDVAMDHSPQRLETELGDSAAAREPLSGSSVWQQHRREGTHHRRRQLHQPEGRDLRGTTPLRRPTPAVQFRLWCELGHHGARALTMIDDGR